MKLVTLIVGTLSLIAMSWAQGDDTKGRRNSHTYAEHRRDQNGGAGT
jgi:hypothetical protein